MVSTSLDPQSQATLDSILQFHNTFNTHNVDAIMTLMTDDCIFENTFPAPDGQRLVGQAAVREAWETLFQGSPQAYFAVEDVFASADRGVLRWTYTWGTPETDPGHIRGVDVMQIRDGKVAEKLSYVKG
ncbi:MAG: nuclear transport factor 2 family protein [Roseiflexaceae bacterium]|nr:nuclear transport factor 2 family protein [Roseiflexaceae bacterium]